MAAAEAEEETPAALEDAAVGAKEALPELKATVDCDGPHVYRCSQGVLFAKRTVEPTEGQVVKLKRPVGTYVYSTGRHWKGPSGGTWCELDTVRVEADCLRWMLVQGPGFGLGGPALLDASVLRPGGLYEAACLRIHRLEERRQAPTVVFESFISRDASLWGIKKAVQEATGLDANRVYLSRQHTRSRPVPHASAGGRPVPDLLRHINDEETIRDFSQEDDDVCLWLVYTGNFDDDYKPATTLARGGA